MRRYLILTIALLTVALAGGGCGPSAEKARAWEQILKNDASLIGLCANQFFLEHQNTNSVTFGVTADGTITGPLHQWISKLGTSVRVIDGKIDGPKDTFTLQQDYAFDGKPVTFDCNGRLLRRGSK